MHEQPIQKLNLCVCMCLNERERSIYVFSPKTYEKLQFSDRAELQQQQQNKCNGRKKFLLHAHQFI